MPVTEEAPTEPDALPPSAAAGPAPQPAGGMPAAARSRSLGSPNGWREAVAHYAAADTRRGLAQILNTALPFLAVSTLMFWCLDRDLWPALLLAPIAAALLVRLFMIQHDCGHGSFFASRRANDLLGRALGVLTLTPYAYWRRTHAVHHATSGNLTRRGTGDIDTLTVEEYVSLSAWRRLVYRVYRHPLVLFGLGPTYLFLLRNRIPLGHPARLLANWTSVLGTNAVLATLFALASDAIGPGRFFLGYLPIVLLAASVGVWLFYVQHQFESTYWQPESRWNFHAAALEGSSFYDLPLLLRWMTACIGLHHIHHLSSKIPNYRLQECLRAVPELRNAKRIGFWESFRCARLALWDEKSGRLVGFAKLRQRFEQHDDAAAAAALSAAGK